VDHTVQGVIAPIALLHEIGHRGMDARVERSRRDSGFGEVRHGKVPRQRPIDTIV
jgi:hypothetical protein